MLGRLVGNATFFCTYASMQGVLGGTREEGTQPSPTATMAAGGIATSLYYLVGHPLDTLQSVVMAQRAPGERFNGTMDVMR
jgi:hypothetical protein